MSNIIIRFIKKHYSPEFEQTRHRTLDLIRRRELPPEHVFNGFKLLVVDEDILLVTHNKDHNGRDAQCLSGLIITPEDAPEIASFIRRNVLNAFNLKVFQFGDNILAAEFVDGVRRITVQRASWPGSKKAFAFNVVDEMPALLMFLSVLESANVLG